MPIRLKTVSHDDISISHIAHDEGATGRASRNALWVRVALATSFLLMAGCGSTAESHMHLEDYLEELEFDQPLEEVQTISLGKYCIFVAIRSPESARSNLPATWFKVKFNLLALVLPEDEKSVQDMLMRHRGMLDDIVLTTCRDTPLEDLNDSRLATLKFRLTDAIQPILGEGKVRRVLINDFVPELI